MARLVYNNFLNGMVSARMRRRADSTVYQTSARLMENLLPIKTGGFTLRDGTEKKAEYADNVYRIIPFTISVHDRYLMVLRNKVADVYNILDDDTLLKVKSLTTPYLAKDIRDIQYAQNYEYLILVHPLYPIQECHYEYNKNLQAYEVVWKAMALEDKVSNRPDFTYLYKDRFFQKERQYPSCVAFCANRLWLASSLDHPYTIWGSQPFAHNNFQTVEYYSYTNEKTSLENYMVGIKQTESVINESVTEDEKKSDGALATAVTKKITISPIEGDTEHVNRKTEYFDAEGNLLKTVNENNLPFVQTTTDWAETITEACAIELEVGSDRNEKIEWISASSDIMVGTASSEWSMPSNINALNQAIFPISAYGSTSNMPAVRGGNALFYLQSGSHNLRGVVGAGNGYQNLDMNYYCHDILKGGVKEIAWQRVPEQRCYCLLNDGTISVLSYDPTYGVNAWSKITTDGVIMSMAVVDSEHGQNLYILVKRKVKQEDNTYIDKYFIEMFKEGLVYDNDSYSFIGVLDTNGIDVSDTVSYNKSISSVFVDSNGSPFRVGQKDCQIERAKVTGNMTKVPVFSRRDNDELIVHLESIAGHPFEVLALITEVKV